MTENIFLGPQITIWLVVPLTVLGLILAIKGRVDLLTGAYLAVVWQAPPVLEFGAFNVSMVWALLPLVALSGAIYLQRFPSDFRDRRAGAVVAWLIAWMLWNVALLIVFPINDANAETLASILVLHFAVPFGALVLFARNIQHLRGFALAFIVVNISVLPSTLMTLFGVNNLVDLIRLAVSPWWKVNQIFINYHTLGRVAAVTILFISVLLADGQTKSGVNRMLLGLMIGPMAYLLIIAGSRQYILGVLVCILVIAWWFLRTRTRQKWTILLALVVASSVIVWLFISSPDFFRLSELSVSQDESGFLAYRPAIFSQMWNWFLQSPIFGNGLYYQEHLSHNLVLDALVTQGIPGLIFLLGLFVFVARCARGTLREVRHSSENTWRLFALLIFLVGLISAFVSGGLLTADVMYVGTLLTWRLSSSPNVIVRKPNGDEQLARSSIRLPEMASPTK